MNASTDDVAASLESELGGLWRFGLRLTANADDAADLVQRTCVRALEQRHKYAAQGKFRSWLFQIQHRIWLNELRSRKIRTHDSLYTTYTATEAASGHLSSLNAAESSDTAETQIFLEQVFGAVESLPEGQRLVVELVLVEECTYQEAADILQIPIGTVMSRLARARVAIGKFQFESEGAEQTTKLTKVKQVV